MTRIYVLSAGRRGDLGQLTDVAEATGLPFEVRHLQFRKAATWRLCLWPKHFLITAVPEVFTGIGPRDVVLCAEASVCALVAQQRRSGTGFIAVCIGRPRGYFDDFDLIVTSPQYELPPGKNIVELAYPPHRLAENIQAAVYRSSSTQSVLRHLCLVGGSSAPDVMDSKAVDRIVFELQEQRSKTGCEIDILFSPRTSPEAQKQIGTWALLIDLRVHRFVSDDGKSYSRLLSKADSISVTSDSVSMVVEAMLTGRPVRIHQLSQVTSMRHTFIRWLSRHDLLKPLFRYGILEPRPNRQKLLEFLRAEKLIEQPQIRNSENQPAPTTVQAAKEILRII